MRRIRYQVACSLDGYIAGPNGEFDWIVMDPDIDFNAIFSQFDTLLMGRRTFEKGGGAFPGMKVFVFSRTLRQAEHPDVTIIADGIEETIHALRNEPGKDIWLYGGGELFRTLLELDCVDSVEPAIIPVILGGGLPLLPAPAAKRSLALTGRRVYEKSGIVLLTYDVEPITPERKGPKKTTRAKSRK